MMYQKLVRDNIPAIIEKNGETCVTRKLTDKEHETALSVSLRVTQADRQRTRDCFGRKVAGRGR